MTRVKQTPSRPHPRKTLPTAPGSSAAAAGGPPQLALRAARVQRKRHWRPGTVALREIRKYQKSTDLLIRRAPFQRLVKEVHQDICADALRGGRRINVTRWSVAGLLAIQEAAEAYLVDMYMDVQRLAIHRKRITITEKDMRILQRLRAWRDRP